MKLLGYGAALAIAAQTLLLTPINLQSLLIAAALAAVVIQLWSVRQHLNQHVDMILLMGSYGGLGMLAGGPNCHMTTAMWLGMFLLGLPPALLGSRCIQEARRHGYFIAYVTADLLGMCAGMYLGHAVIRTHDPLLHHLSMLIGMLAGMGAGAALISVRGARELSTRSHI